VERLVTRKRVVWLGIGAMVVFLLADAFVATPAHDVHTPGATSLAAALIKNDAPLIEPVQPSESIFGIRCQLWQREHGAQPCPDDIVRTYFSLVVQTPRTLYIPWFGCISWSGSGAVINWQGFNLEYVQAGRRLVIHCYLAEPWFAHHETLFGVAALPNVSLLVVPTGAIAPGTLQIIEDDRLEHLLGDQSTESLLATATIS
jgi:hypothetical protein